MMTSNANKAKIIEEVERIEGASMRMETENGGMPDKERFMIGDKNQKFDHNEFSKWICDEGREHFVTARDDKSIYIYRDGIYVQHGDMFIRSILDRVMDGDMVTTYTRSETLKHIQDRTHEDRNVFDSNPNIVNLANGLYNLQTRSLLPHTPDHKSLHKSPIMYDPEATCPAIDAFIDDVLPMEYRQTFYEIGGYAMEARKNMKTVFIFLGEKNSGKSVAEAILQHLVGDKSTTHVSPLIVSNNTYGAAEYYGKQLNLVDDLGNTSITDTGVLKSVIASAPINAQFKYAQPFDYTPNVLCIFATNEVPKIEPFDDAFASRFSIVPFPNLFEIERPGHKTPHMVADPNLDEKLLVPEELSGFFNKCMTAIVDMRERGSFSGDITLADRINEYRNKSSPVQQFIDEQCTTNDPDAYVMKDTLYRAYTKWSESNGCRTEEMGFLTKAVKPLGCVVQLKTTDDGERRRAYVGIDFKHGVSDFVY